MQQGVSEPFRNLGPLKTYWVKGKTLENLVAGASMLNGYFVE